MSNRDHDGDASTEPGAEESRRRSHRDKKRERTALAAITERLAALRPHERETLVADEDLLDALEELARLSGSARNRQAKVVAALLRDADLDALGRRLDRGLGSSYAQTPEDDAGPADLWLERLLAEGDPAIQALVETQPEADRRQLRQLVRTAGKTPPSPATLRARRALRGMIEDLIG